MSEDGKYRFRLTQLLIDKLIMVGGKGFFCRSKESIDFRRKFWIFSRFYLRNLRKKSMKRIRERNSNSSIPFHHHILKISVNLTALSLKNHLLSFHSLDDPFLYTGINPNSHTSTTLTIPPEQDPNSIFLNTILPSSTTTTRKRKGANPVNPLENDRPPNPTGSKRGRHRTKNLLPPEDMEWAPNIEKRPPKSAAKKLKQPMPPTATTSILNTLLQLPSNQPKQRTNDSNLLKTIHQPPSFVNTVLSSNPFL